jgi:alpha-glucosidase
MHYPSDSATHAIDKQFFYGPSILVSPVTDADSTSVTFYLPSDIFYDLFTFKRVQGSGATVTYTDIPFTDIPAHIRGGSIIPARVNSANTTKALRDQDFELLIAPDKDGKAAGTLYLDDGESLNQAGTSEVKFSYEGSTVKMDGRFGFSTKVGVKSVTVMGEGDPAKYEINEGLAGPFEHDLSQMKRIDL